MNYGTPYVTYPVANYGADVRTAFVRKVYNLFFVSILVTVGVAFVTAQPAALPITLPLAFVFMIAAFITLLVLSFTKMTPVLNVSLFYLFAALEGGALGPYLGLMNQRLPGIVPMAAVLTIATFGGLSAYVLTTKKDFSYLGGGLMVGLIVLIVAGLVLMFLHVPFLHLLYTVGGLLLFCGYVLYDTSVIMTRLTPDQAVTGAIELYLDFVNLFLFILRLLSSLSGRD